MYRHKFKGIKLQVIGRNAYFESKNKHTLYTLLDVHPQLDFKDI